MHAKTGDVFVSDSAASRVIRVNGDGEQQDVVTDFPQSTYGKGPIYNIGPLGLAFIDDTTLVVGGGGLPDGEEPRRQAAVCGCTLRISHTMMGENTASTSSDWVAER